MSELSEPILERAEAKTRTRWRVLRGSIIGLIATVASLLVSQGSVSAVGWNSYVPLVRGFPIPYITYNQCDVPFCDSQSLIFNPLTGFHVLYALANFGVWFTISIGILLFISSTSVGRKSMEILTSVVVVSGLGITLLTLLLRPISLVYPMFATEFSLGFIGGFPWEYFVKGIFELPLAPSLTGSSFSVMNFVADFALWSLVVISLIGYSTVVVRRRVVPNSQENYVGNSS